MKWKVYQFGVKSTILNENLEEEVYILYNIWGTCLKDMKKKF